LDPARKIDRKKASITEAPGRVAIELLADSSVSSMIFSPIKGYTNEAKSGHKLIYIMWQRPVLKRRTVTRSVVA
jgi:hypothetical protein